MLRTRLMAVAGPSRCAPVARSLHSFTSTALRTTSPNQQVLFQSRTLTFRPPFPLRHASTAAALKPVPAPAPDPTPDPTTGVSEQDVAEAFAKHPLTEQDHHRLKKQRNIGVSAHIDSGKTTLTERILFYTGRIREIHEVRGKDAVGAKMDSMELEREKGITIQSAATFCDWDAPDPGAGADAKNKKSYAINIIDTPGHVDFTIEVERALRVLDGAVLVLCAVAGVQSQTTTVDRQMRRYNVPRISFINKMDRPGANPWRVINQIRQKLRISAAAVQVPIGSEDDLRGIIDLVRMEAVFNEGTKGVEVRSLPIDSPEAAIPQKTIDLAREKRRELLEVLADVDEAMADAFLEERNVEAEELAAAIRRATINLNFSPVFMGSAIKNTAIQPLLDGVCAYLPNPAESPVPVTAHIASSPNATTKGEAESGKLALSPAADAPLIALAFKLEESRFGQLTYMRVYQGTLKKAQTIFHSRTSKKVKVPRLVRMHSNEMEDIESIGPGEICAIFGVECASGDTFTDGRSGEGVSMESMFVPDPVVSLSLKPSDGGAADQNFSRALQRFQREDPTFRVHVDAESKETIVSGMGELHLEVYVERMKREYGVNCVTGRPQVAYRETPMGRTEISYTHRKQSGGAGQFARLSGYIEPVKPVGMEDEVSHDEGELETGTLVKAGGGKNWFENITISGSVPEQYIPGVIKGFQDFLAKGSLTGAPVTNCRFVLQDGGFHVVDSSEIAFRLCTVAGVREAVAKGGWAVMEPVMEVEVVAPVEFQSNVIAGLTARRGTILDSEVRDDEVCVRADVALNDMFGYSSQLRGATQGKGEFSMEYKTHSPVLPHAQKELEEAYRNSRPQKK